MRDTMRNQTISSLSTEYNATRRWEWRDKVDTWNMSWQTASERSETYQHGTSYQANACGATVCFCHATQTGATKRVRSANIYPDELFLK